MTLRIIPLEEKLAAVMSAADDARRQFRPPGSMAQKRYEILKAVAADLRQRQELPRNQTLGELTRRLQIMKDAPRTEAGHYDHGQLVGVANFVISRWSTISQALERFGEESAE